MTLTSSVIIDCGLLLFSAFIMFNTPTFLIRHFAVYFAFVYFKLSRFEIKFAAFSSQIPSDMTCA